jgi:hypothetical protein
MHLAWKNTSPTEMASSMMSKLGSTAVCTAKASLITMPVL